MSSILSSKGGAYPSTSVVNLNDLFTTFNELPKLFKGQLSEAWVYFADHEVTYSGTNDSGRTAM